MALALMCPSSGSQATAPAPNLGAEPGHAGNDRDASGELRVGLDFRRDHRLELGELGADRLADHPLCIPDHFWRLVLAELPDLGRLFDQQAAGRHQPVEQVAIWIVCQRRFDGEGLGEPTNHLGVDRVVFGQPTGRAGEIPHPLRSTMDTAMPAWRNASAQPRS